MLEKMWKLFVVATLLLNGVFCPKVDLEDIWQNYKTLHGKSYDVAEEKLRRGIFEDNVRVVTQHNLMADFKQRSFTLGINAFSDLTLKEFGERFSTMNIEDDPLALVANFDYVDIKNLPPSIDYRDFGMVTPVEYQGTCGSCYAFAGLGAVEAAWMNATGILQPLSKQNIVDCSRQSSWGCLGGSIRSVFRYIIKNHGVDNQRDYPYEDRRRNCRFKPESVAANITSFKNVLYGSEEDLQKAIVTAGPVAVAAFVELDTFKHYAKGVFEDERCAGEPPNHAMLCIGYGIEDQKEYWLIKNSMSFFWGDRGYIKMAKNANNMCGIASHGSYPIV